MKYYVHMYEEAPVEPEADVVCGSLREARAIVRSRLGGLGGLVATRVLAGERYEDGLIHVEAYYANTQRSSGYWILHD
jgi:hypothetical protein